MKREAVNGWLVCMNRMSGDVWVEVSGQCVGRFNNWDLAVSFAKENQA